MKTTDGDIFSIVRFAISDSTLVIFEAGRLSESDTPSGSFTIIDKTDLPIILPLDEIERWEYIVVPKYKTTAVLIGIVILTIRGLVIYALTHSFPA